MKPLTIAFIPLRKDSKGIPGKNIKPFAGKPLLFWAIDSLLCVESLDQIWIATDCEDTERLVKTNYRNIQVFRRCPENAMDHSPTIDVALEFLQRLHFPADTNFLLVQATSPFTTPEEFKGAIRLIGCGLFDSVISCVRLNKFLWSETGKPLNYSLGQKPRRQDFDGFLVESGSFYLSRVGHIMESRQLISGKVGIAEVSHYGQIELDEPVDWVIGEALMNYLISTGIYIEAGKNRI